MKGGCSRSNTKISELDKTLFRGKNVGPFNVPVYYTLFMEVEQSMEYL